MTVDITQHTLKPAALSEEGVEVGADPGLLTYSQARPTYELHGGEIVILALKPSTWYLVRVSVRWVVTATVVILLAPWLTSLCPVVSPAALMQAALLITTARLIVALLQWSSRLYILTNRRVMCYRGVLQVALFEAPLVQIRNTYLNFRWIEKPIGVGSIAFTTKGSGKVDARWESVAGAEDVHQQIRRAIEKALDNHLPY